MKKIIILLSALTLLPQTTFTAAILSGQTLKNTGNAIVMKPDATFRSINGAGMTEWTCSTKDKFGNTIMGGTYRNTSGNRFAVAIINPNQVSQNALTILPAFSTGSNETCAGITTDTEGNIIIAGTSSDPMGNNYFAAARLVAKIGVIDHSFGLNGITRITAPIAGGINNQCTAVAITKKGIIVLAGTSTDIYGTSYLAVVELTPTGGLNTPFGRSGRLYISPTLAGGVDDECDAMTIDDATNTIILTGTSADQAGSAYFALARVPAN